MNLYIKQMTTKSYGGNYMTTGYCVKCKKKNVEMKNAKTVTMKNGRKATKGECPTCGCGMYRIGG